MSLPVKLRAHHLLCLQGFQGKGYDGDFTQNLALIAARFKNESDLMFELIDGADDICAPCPHRDGVNCAKDATADARMRHSDGKTMERLGLAPNYRASAKTLATYANAVITTRKDAQAVCGACPWQRDCSWHLHLSDTNPCS